MKPGYSRDIIAANIESEMARGLSRREAAFNAPHDWGTMDARDYQNAQSGGAAYGKMNGFHDPARGMVIDAEEIG